MSSIIKKISKLDRLFKKLEKIDDRADFIKDKIEKAKWINDEKTEALILMIDLFVEFAHELAKKQRNF